MRNESKVGGEKAEIAGVGSAQLEEWHSLVSSKEREKMCSNLISRLVSFSTANSRTDRNKAKGMVFKMSVVSGLVEPNLILGRRKQNTSEVEAKRTKKILVV